MVEANGGLDKTQFYFAKQSVNIKRRRRLSAKSQHAGSNRFARNHDSCDPAAINDRKDPEEHQNTISSNSLRLSTSSGRSLMSTKEYNTDGLLRRERFHTAQDPSLEQLRTHTMNCRN